MCVALLVAVAACGKAADTQPVPAPARGSGWTCEQLPFAASTPVPEASAAAWMTIDGKLVLVVVGDSGQHGAYGLIDPETGATGEQAKLPLGDAGDDLEGLAVRDDLLFGLTSAGWMRVWKRAASGFELVDGPYPIAAVDEALPKNGGLGDKPPKGDGMVCDKYGVNCGRNYEGLCLAPKPTAQGCTGYVAAKADGHLYCLTLDGSHLAVEREHAIAISRPGQLADCTYDEAGTLWAADNLFGMSQVDRVQPPNVEPVAQIGVGFPEVLAVRGDIFYRMSDTGGAPSLVAKFRCTAVTK
jgi:hypothetical protein